MDELTDRDHEILAAMAHAGGDLPDHIELTDDDIFGLRGLAWYCVSRECWTLNAAGWRAAGYDAPGYH